MLLVSPKLRFENCDSRSYPACAKLVPNVNRERDGKTQLCKVPALVGGEPVDWARYQSLIWFFAAHCRHSHEGGDALKDEKIEGNWLISEGRYIHIPRW